MPILWIEGAEGSGKSLLMSVFASIHGVKIQNASWTFASIRNEIEMNSKDAEGNEKHFVLCVDNLNEETFRNEQLYTLFLCGYDRKDSITAIALPGGENLEFNTFCPKITTTVHGLLGIPRYAEIKRRCIRVLTKSINAITKFDKSNEIDLDNFIDIRGLDLSVLRQKFVELWDDKHLGEYMILWRKMNKMKFDCGIPRKKLSLDLAIPGVISGVWPTPQSAIAAIDQYWNWSDEKDVLSPLSQIIQDFIQSESVSFDNLGISPEIAPKRLKQHVAFCASEGLLDCIPTDKIIYQTMQSLGWKQDSINNSTRKWRKI